jgi:hypothetical protein
LPAISFASAATTVSEGDTAEVTLTRSGQVGGTSSVDVSTLVGDTDTASGVDFTATAGTVTFPPGAAATTFSVPTTEDGDDEQDETVQLQLSDPVAATLSPDPVTSTLTIADDDVDPKDSVPPVGLISVPTQRIDRKISARFACDDTCDARLTLKLGSKTLDKEAQALADSGVARFSFALSAKEVRLVKRKARGSKSANLRVQGTFSDAQGSSSSTAKFQLG